MRDYFRRTRVRLTLAFLVGSGLLAVTSAVAFWLVFVHFQYASIDATLEAQAQTVAAGIDETGGQVNFAAGPLPGETKGGIAVVALLVGPHGAILDDSGSVAHAGAFAAIAATAARSRSPVTLTIAHRAERVLVQQVGKRSSPHYVLLARPLSEVDQVLREIAVLLAVIVAALVAGAAALGYFVAGRALRPVRVMASAVREISEHDLGRRLALELPPGDELGELAATFNRMLARLETSFDTLGRFTADAAHELRTPLTLMRAQVDVTLRREQSVAEYQNSHRLLRTEIERLSRITEQLLLLARADAGSLQARVVPLNLRELVEEIAARWRRVASERRVTLKLHLTAEEGLRADADLLRRCLDNLIDNAVRHAPQGSEVVVEALRQGEWWTITVGDSGPGVDQELRTRIFERFTRADHARGRKTGGAGLGLALCLAVAQAHGGELTLLPARSGSGAEFRVSLPN